MAERIERLRHLLPAGTSITERYINPQRPQTRFRRPSRNRSSHGNYLRQRLAAMHNRAVELGHQRVAFGLDADESICIEFVGEVGHDLAVSSLQNAGQGIELLTSHQRDNIISATVYVPPGKVDYFIQRVEQYLEKETPKGKPKNQNLVEGTSDVRMALLEAFWSDVPSLMPRPGADTWWEVWLRVGSTTEPVVNDAHDEILTSFREYAIRTGLSLGDEQTILRFPERLVLLVRGTLEQMTRSVELLNCIAELRLAHVRVEDFLALSPIDQAEWIRDLRRRTSPPILNAPAVCLLDTGVTRIHPLLEIGLNEDDCHTYHPGWGCEDRVGHGTQMAGVALYGDLAETMASNDDVTLLHRLESVKILPPAGYPPNDPSLYGYVIQQAVARVEIQSHARKRVICMTVTSAPPDHLRVSDVSSEDQGGNILEQINAFHGRGRPSSWSAAIDQLSSGATDAQSRLLLLPAGNTQQWSRRYYPNSNLTESIHDPGQAWNALTIGAYTMKTTVDPSVYPDWVPVAPAGGLSPASTTSLLWEEQWPSKPDLCMEGGNMAIDPSTGEPDYYVNDLQLLTTNHTLIQQLLTVTGDTSAATALAARMTAIIQAEYPQFWPETVRALMVHSADWTHAMRRQEQLSSSRQAMKNLLRTYGYGVPNLDRALWSARNELTLVVQDSLQPFDRQNGRTVTRDMHLHPLPWPCDVLQELGDTLVELRVTLSYFIEPNPGERRQDRRHRYASHGLRFDVNTPTEAYEDFRRRLSTAAREEEDYVSTTSSDAENWLLGPVLRHRGSIHSDRWTGTAVDLASRGIVAVYPVIGWWRERPRHEKWGKRARYSLIVSIYTPETSVDIYSPVAIQIPSEITL